MRSILIIEDDPLVRKTLASQLAKKGFDIAVAETGEAGVAAFAETPPDLVLLDVRLPTSTAWRSCDGSRSATAGPSRWS